MFLEEAEKVKQEMGSVLHKSEADSCYGSGDVTMWQWRNQVQFFSPRFNVYIPDLVFFIDSSKFHAHEFYITRRTFSSPAPASRPPSSSSAPASKPPRQVARVASSCMAVKFLSLPFNLWLSLSQQSICGQLVMRVKWLMRLKLPVNHFPAGTKS
ncbi:hypothetical protein L3X38_017010 [Prunus dulcis]|uniref:Uncharacterized protein n=1 Tax=Prunus dulcis TaxID=3755 RepID=A0AAD4W6I9_PRUDU|nr:hypothetical protein L3X38_017010 [Prunus dulcis]